MKIIYSGDVVGRAGRDALLTALPQLKDKFKPDIFIANVENAAHGFGVTPGICRDFLDAGIDALVTGNHVWQQREIIPFLDACKKIVRPLNYPAALPGQGFCEIELINGKKILITQLLGRVFMEAVDSPVQAIDALLKNYTLGKNVAAIFVDIHGEATSEKLALGHYLDGRVSIVAGSHTHIPTADATIRDNGTAYITDVGMCGTYNSVLGFEKEAPIARIAQKYDGSRLVPCTGGGSFSGIYVETDDKTGLATHIELIQLKPNA